MGKGVIDREWPFHLKPLLVFWETTKACMLACKHCRASAILEPLPGELSHEEALKLIDDMTGFGPPLPILVFTGGDPLLRKDIWELVSYAKGKGFRVALAPAVSPILNDQAISRMVEYRVDAISISLDGAKPETHDGIRGVKGVYNRTLDVIRKMIDSGLRVQVNTAVMRDNVLELPEMVSLLNKINVKTWEVFYLIPVGRAGRNLDLTPQEWEDVSHFLYEASKYGILVRTTEGPMFRRVAIFRRILELNGINPDRLLKPGPLYEKLVKKLRELMGEPSSEPSVMTTSTRDGKGTLFISYDGKIYPSGFVEYPLGNVRLHNIVEVYRESSVLKMIRAAEFKGRCGICEFRDLCGGSRSRAFAILGDILGEDPACPYEPGKFTDIIRNNNIDLSRVLSEIKGLSYVLPLISRKPL